MMNSSWPDATSCFTCACRAGVCKSHHSEKNACSTSAARGGWRYGVDVCACVRAWWDGGPDMLAQQANYCVGVDGCPEHRHAQMNLRSGLSSRHRMVASMMLRTLACWMELLAPEKYCGRVRGWEVRAAAVEVKMA